jgi:hypothetical protein
MKYLAVLLPIILFSTNAYSQTDSIRLWNKWCARRDTPLLFTAANNIIEIYSPTLRPADIQLKSLDRSLKIGTAEIKNDTLEVMTMPYPEKAKNMRLAINNKKSRKTIKTVNFSCDKVPPLVARVGTITGHEAPRKEILSQTAIRAHFPNSLYSYPYRIKQYTYHIHTDSVNATITVPNFFLTKDILQTIKNAPVGTVIEFSDIKATCPECVTRTLDNITLKIK